MRISIASSAFLIAASLVTSLPVHAGAPLKGVDVKLGRSPGGGAQARTDASGHFAFSMLPKGTYELTIEQHVETVRTARTPPKVAAPPCDIELRGAKGGTMAVTWDGARFHPAARPGAKAAALEKVSLTSDGVHSIAGIITTTTAR